MAIESTTTMHEETVAALQELVQINIDSHKGFDEASKRLKNANLVALCRELAAERRHQADELSPYIAINGEQAPSEGSFLAAVHRCWLNSRNALSGDDEYAVLAEAERGEDHIKSAYEDVLKRTAGSPVNDVLTRQYAAVKAAHDRIHDLRDARK